MFQNGIFRDQIHLNHTGQLLIADQPFLCLQGCYLLPPVNAVLKSSFSFGTKVTGLTSLKIPPQSRQLKSNRIHKWSSTLPNVRPVKAVRHLSEYYASLLSPCKSASLQVCSLQSLQVCKSAVCMCRTPLGDPCASRAEAVRFTRLTGSR